MYIFYVKIAYSRSQWNSDIFDISIAIDWFHWNKYKKKHFLEKF